MRSLVLAERKRFAQVCAGPVLGKGLVNTIGGKGLLLFAARNNQTIFFKLTDARGHCESALPRVSGEEDVCSGPRRPVLGKGLVNTISGKGLLLFLMLTSALVVF